MYWALSTFIKSREETNVNDQNAPSSYFANLSILIFFLLLWPWGRGGVLGRGLEMEGKQESCGERLKMWSKGGWDEIQTKGEETYTFVILNKHIKFCSGHGLKAMNYSPPPPNTHTQSRMLTCTPPTPPAVWLVLFWGHYFSWCP